MRIQTRAIQSNRPSQQRSSSTVGRDRRIAGNASESAGGGREGTTLIELAFVLPVFLVFLGGIIEFGHAFMVSSTLHNATKVAARDGVAGNMTSAQVKQAVIDRLDGVVDTSNLTVMVKDASILATTAGQGEVDVSALPDLELDTASATQLYLVRVEIAYSDVALMVPLWVNGVDISGQSVMRRE